MRANRKDRICPRCSTRPRHVSKTGKPVSYCKPCYAEMHRERSYRRLTDHTDKPCRKCGKSPRAVSGSGWQYDLCHPCRFADSKRSRLQVQANLLARIDAGEVIMCRCGKHPVHITVSRKVQQYCRECLNRDAVARKRRMRAAAVEY